MANSPSYTPLSGAEKMKQKNMAYKKVKEAYCDLVGRFYSQVHHLGYSGDSLLNA